MEEEELARLELAQEDAEAHQPVGGLLARGGLEDDGGHAARRGGRRDPGSEVRVRCREETLDGDALGFEVAGEEARMGERVRGLEDAEDDGGKRSSAARNLRSWTTASAAPDMTFASIASAANCSRGRARKRSR